MGIAMTIHLTRQILSEHLDLPELRPFIGKQVEITIQETAPNSNVSRWQALADVGGADLIDPEVVGHYRAFDVGQQKAADDPR
jgi:hypothetical protein